MKVWTENNRDKIRMWAKRRYRRMQDTDPEWREKERARNRKRRPAAVTTPAKNRARNAVNNAIRDGLLVKPEVCSKCHEPTPSRKLHGHHADHAQLLNVEWLCTVCHGKEHRG